MKLTEQQLAQMFQNSKNTKLEQTVDDLHTSVDASDKRLADVEKITNNSTLSASYQIINQLQDWSQAIGSDIELNLKPNLTSIVLSWFKPTLATAAIVTAVYFVTPNITAEIDNNYMQQKPDSIMFTASFEGNNDVIKSLSFDKSLISEERDAISKINFS